MAGGRAAGDGGQLGRILPDLWAALLDDAKARARVHERVYRRGPGQCHYWLGALSSSGYGRVRLGVRAVGARRRASVVVAAHVYLYQESRGLLRPLPDGSYPLVRHRCGEPSCLNPIHLTAATARGGAAGMIAVGGTAGPAADIRGAQGRAMAIRNAIVGAVARVRRRGRSRWPSRRRLWLASRPGRRRCRSQVGSSCCRASAGMTPSWRPRRLPRWSFPAGRGSCSERAELLGIPVEEAGGHFVLAMGRHPAPRPRLTGP